jgi:hypothetical protein
MASDSEFREADFIEGVHGAVTSWLRNYPISFPSEEIFRKAVSDAVQAATYEWLCHNEEEVLNAVAQGVKTK